MGKEPIIGIMRRNGEGWLPPAPEGRGQSRSAGFQPAVSQCFQPARALNLQRALGWRTCCRLEIGDTAGWKPALRSYSRALSTALGYRVSACPACPGMPGMPFVIDKFDEG